ncbi:outer membrane efflux protein [Spirochaeta thermophila DSM 6578]|uniref:Outer membrane efflux protein n=1 Tax=Winmispira thermophila (strain ATCC 700085 / DSM 6578 / Z-1203) TaxID=869211 RepID=G0GEC3_WINT7|nr:TolC family protein [Spirochaeta thermophila]AEJ62260.1 outer membrane efflux protein [Spirochaeta thermophila DSM 6578]
MKPLQTLFFLTLLATLLPAQSPDLPTLLTLAFQHDPDIHALSAEASAADASRHQALASLLPSLGLSASAAFQSDIPHATLTLPIGTLDLELGDTTSYQAGLLATWEWSLGMEGLARLEAARHTLTAARLLVSAHGQELTRTILTLAFRYRLSLASTQSLQAALARLQAHRERLTALKTGGLASEKDELDLLVQITQTAARIEEVEADSRLILRELALRCGLDRLEGLSIPPELLTVQAPSTLEPLRDRLTTLPAALAVEARIHTQAALLEAAKASWWPHLQVQAGGTLEYPGLSLTEDEADILFTGRIGLTWPLFTSGARTAHIDEQKARLEAARATHTRTIRDLALAFDRLLEEAHTRYTAYQADREILALAERRHAIVQEEWRQGQTPLAQLLEAEQRLREAELGVQQALYAYLLAYHQTRLFAGSPLLPQEETP